MIEWLTDTHDPMPPFIDRDGMRHEIQALAATAEHDPSADALLRELGGIPHRSADGDAPLGYTEWALGEDSVWAREPAGTQEERDEATLAQWRETYEIEAWKGRVVLASMPAATEGPIAAFPGASLWNQIEALCQATLSPPEFERFRGTTIWRRSDPQIVGLAAVIGLTDEQIDAWFQSAAGVS